MGERVHLGIRHMCESVCDHVEYYLTTHIFVCLSVLGLKKCDTIPSCMLHVSMNCCLNGVFVCLSVCTCLLLFEMCGHLCVALWMHVCLCCHVNVHAFLFVYICICTLYTWCVLMATVWVNVRTSWNKQRICLYVLVVVISCKDFLLYSINRFPRTDISVIIHWK